MRLTEIYVQTEVIFLTVRGTDATAEQDFQNISATAIKVRAQVKKENDRRTSIKVEDLR